MGNIVNKYNVNAGSITAVASTLKDDPSKHIICAKENGTICCYRLPIDQSHGNRFFSPVSSDFLLENCSVIVPFAHDMNIGKFVGISDSGTLTLFAFDIVSNVANLLAKHMNPPPFTALAFDEAKSIIYSSSFCDNRNRLISTGSRRANIISEISELPG